VGKRAGHARRYQARFRPHAGFVLANALFAAIFVALALSAFHAPSPHGLPVGIVASPAVTGQVEDALGTHLPGGFDLRVYPSAAAARAGLTHAQVDGALIASPGHLHLLVAEGGGTAPAQALTTAFGTVAARSGQPLTVTDVVPPRPGDTQALSSFFILLGVLVPSLAAGSASALVFRRSRPAWCVAAPVVVAVAVGAVAAGLADGIAGLGHYPAIAAIAALFSLAVAAPTAALGRLWPPLVAAALLVFLVFSLPVSGGPAGLASFGPGFLRVLHPALPLGTGVSAVRAAVYFGGYGAAGPLWVLGTWAVAGVAALALVTAWRRRRAPAARVPLGPVLDAAATAAGGLVVGFDNSEPSRRALGWAARQLAPRLETLSATPPTTLSTTPPTTLSATPPTPLHVVYSDHRVIDSDLSGFGYAEMEAARDAEAARVAAAAAEIMTAAGQPYTFERRQEAAADAIVAEASAQADALGGAPVIVVGRAGHTAHQILGSVPVRLLHHSPYPVLTIP
jgi:nucleotide-binding universal stress UspA family protein